MSPSPFRPSLKLFADAELERIVGEAMAILESLGVLVENEDARRLLLDAGARDRNGRMSIPEPVVRSALSSAPSRILVHDRDGKQVMDLGDDRVHFDPGSAAVHLFDGRIGRRRAITSKDAADFARLVDGLPHYAAQSTAIVPEDVPKEIADRHRLYLALRSSRKPVVTGTFLKEAFAPMLAMLTAVRGNAEELRRRPLAIFDCCPSPPLKWSDLTCQALIDCARAGVPAELVSMPMTGATAPVTLREAVVQHTAENLSGVAIHQLAGAGSPILHGGAACAFDMRHGTTPLGAIESMMIGVAHSQIGKHLGLPTHAYLGVSDAKCPDYQAGLESGIGAVLAALAGINVVSGPGLLDFVICQSFEKVLLDHDACGMALRLVRGIAERDGSAQELLRALIGAGELLSHPHTRKHWRDELFVPSSLVARQSHGDWEASGSPWAHQTATKEVERRLLERAPPPLDPEVAAELQRIMLSEAGRYGMSALPPSSVLSDEA